MQKKMHDAVYKFCNRKYLRKKHPTMEIKNNGNRDYVYLDDPILLARFAGEIKNKLGKPSNRGWQVFFRGQDADYPAGMVPSLFRSMNENATYEFTQRIEAYQVLTRELQKITGLKRFEGEIGGAILQHYGIRTPWIDLVDNLFIALWFACYERTKTPPYSFHPKSKDQFGWIYFLKFENSVAKNSIVEGNQTRWCDLRINQTSLSLRPHSQHGIFGSLKKLDDSNYNLDNLIVATVKFPVKQNFLRIAPIPVGFLFPSPYYDNTYKTLRTKKFEQLVKRVDKEYNLNGVLGQIDEYKTSMPLA